MYKITLSKGKFALVDKEDFEYLNQWKWTYDGKKYAMRNIYGDGGILQKVRLHRLLADAKEGEQVDHVNGDKLDNRRSNLRICTSSQNSINWLRKSSSGYRGVYKNKNHYRAAICLNGVKKHLGNFSDKKEAAKAYNVAATVYHKEFAVLNKL